MIWGSIHWYVHKARGLIHSVPPAHIEQALSADLLYTRGFCVTSQWHGEGQLWGRLLSRLAHYQQLDAEALNNMLYPGRLPHVS